MRKRAEWQTLARMHDLETRLTREFGIRYPFVSAGMGFVAHERLAAAVTNAGGTGLPGRVARSTRELDASCSNGCGR